MTRDKLLKGGVWLGVSRITMLILQLSSTIILAWMLSPEDYGLVAIAMTIVMLLSAVTSMQLGEALIRHQDDGARTTDLAFTMDLIRGLLLSAILALCAMPAAAFFDDPRLFEIIFALSLLPLISGLSNPCRYLRQKILVFKYEVIIEISQKLVAVATTLFIAYVYGSYWALVVGALVEQLWGTALSYVLIRYRPRLKLAGFRKLLDFSVWLTFGQAVNTLNWHLEYLLIGKFLGPAPLGVYRMGGNLAQTPVAGLMAPIRQVVYPGFTSITQDHDNKPHDEERVRIAYQRAQSLTTVFALPVGVGFALIADPFVRLALDPRWHEVTYIIQFLAAVFAFQTLGSLVQPLAMAKNETRILFIRAFQMLAIRLPIILVCLYVWSIPGVVVARVLTGAIGMLVNMFLVRRLIQLPILSQIKVNIRAIVSVVAMAIGVSLISAEFGVIESRIGLVWQILFEIAAGSIIYTGTMILMWLAMKRPHGPETELRGVFQKRFSRALG